MLLITIAGFIAWPSSLSNTTNCCFNFPWIDIWKQFIYCTYYGTRRFIRKVKRILTSSLWGETQSRALEVCLHVSCVSHTSVSSLKSTAVYFTGKLLNFTFVKGWAEFLFMMWRKSSAKVGHFKGWFIIRANFIRPGWLLLWDLQGNNWLPSSSIVSIGNSGH